MNQQIENLRQTSRDNREGLQVFTPNRPGVQSGCSGTEVVRDGNKFRPTSAASVFPDGRLRSWFHPGEVGRVVKSSIRKGVEVVVIEASGRFVETEALHRLNISE